MVTVGLDEVERDLTVLGVSEPVSQEKHELLFQIFIPAHVLFCLSGKVPFINISKGSKVRWVNLASYQSIFCSIAK